MPTRHIAFIGLGAMGGAMAETLVRKQFRVTGYDQRPEASPFHSTATAHAPPRRAAVA